MMVREVKLVGAGLITLLHVCFLSFCDASENQPCRLSSCEDIRNITNLFLLKGGKPSFGNPDPAYELVCGINHAIF